MTSTQRFSRRTVLRSLVGSASVLAAGPILAACSQPAATPTAAPTAAASQPTAAATPAAQAKAPAAGKTQITMIHAWHEAIAGPYFDPLVKDFNAKSTDVELVHSFAPTSEINQKVLAAQAGGQPYDITWGSTVYQLASAGKLVALDSYIEADKFDKSQFHPGMLGLFTVGGKLIGLPIENSVTGVWIHNDLLKAANVTLPKDDWNREDFVTVAKQLTVGSGDSISQYGYALHMSALHYLLNLNYQNGGTVLNKELTKFTMNSEEGVTALKFMADLVLTHKVQPPPGGGFQQGFQAKKYVMAYDGPWRHANYTRELKLDVSAVPSTKNSKNGRQDHVLWGTSLFVTQSKAERHDAAWKFLSWFFDRDRHAQWAVNTGYLPCRKDSMATADYKKFVEGDGKQMAAFLYGFEKGIVEEGRMLPNYGKITTAITDLAIDPVLLGKKTAKEGLDDAAATINGDPTLFTPLKVS